MYISKRVLQAFGLLIILILAVALIGGLFLSGGSESYSLSSESYRDPLAPPVSQPVGGSNVGGDYYTLTDSSTVVDGITTTEPNQAQVQERLIIKNANLTLQVDDAQEAVDTVNSIVNEMGGWIVSNQMSSFTNATGEEDHQASMNIRVPAENLDAFLAQLRLMAMKVVYEQISGQDVTGEYVDLQSQLGNLQAAEEQLQTIMEDAETTQDVLAVYGELVRIRGEIDVITGRMNFLSQSAAYSSVSITLSPEPAEPQPESDSWHPADDVENALEAFVEGLQFAGSAAIYFVICLLPILLMVGIPAYAVYRRRRSKAS